MLRLLYPRETSLYPLMWRLGGCQGRSECVAELRKSPPTGIRTVIRKMSLLLSPAQSLRMIPTTAEKSWYPLMWRLGGCQGWSGCVAELRNSPPTGIRTVIQKMSLLLSPAQSMRMIPTIAEKSRNPLTWKLGLDVLPSSENPLQPGFEV